MTEQSPETVDIRVNYLPYRDANAADDADELESGQFDHDRAHGLHDLARMEGEAAHG